MEIALASLSFCACNLSLPNATCDKSVSSTALAVWKHDTVLSFSLYFLLICLMYSGLLAFFFLKENESLGVVFYMEA